MHIYIHIYIYAYIHTHIYIYIHIYIHIHTRTHAHTHTRTHTHTNSLQLSTAVCQWCVYTHTTLTTKYLVIQPIDWNDQTCLRSSVYYPDGTHLFTNNTLKEKQSDSHKTKHARRSTYEHATHCPVYRLVLDEHSHDAGRSGGHA